MRVKSGVTIIEVLLGAAILVFCLSGILASYVSAFVLGDVARDISTAMNSVQAKLEEIRNDDFVNVTAETFALDGFAAGDSMGVVEVRDIGNFTNLKEVRITASFRSGRRIIGEDADLDGSFDEGSEDSNGNGRLDSPVEVVTLLTN